jgi:O-antigen/teichoic acid export membrane protein
MNSFLRRFTISANEKTIIQRSGVAFAIQAAGAVLSFVLQVLLARWIGKEGYGNFSYAYNWAQILAVFGAFGFTISILRFLPDYIARKDWSHVQGLLATFRLITLGASSLMALLVMVYFGIFGQEGINELVLFAGIGLTPLIAMKDLNTEAIRGSNQIGLAYGPPYVLQPILVIALSLMTLNVVGFMSSMGAVTALGISLFIVIIGQSIILRRVLLQTQQTTSAYAVSEWLKPSPSLLIVQGALVVMSRSDLLVVGLLLGATDVGVYAAATKSAYLIGFVLVAVNAVIAPKIAPLYSDSDKQGLQELVKKGTRLAASIALIATIFMIGFSAQILELFGEGFAAARVSLIILSIGQLANAATGPVGYLLNLTGHQRVTALVYSLAALLGVVLAYVLVPTMGFNGAAIGAAMALVFQNLTLYVLVQRYLGLNTWGFSFVNKLKK